MEEKEYPFAFSVVMAVYNVEPFLREAVGSLIAQNFGFENIQLIMVDDGSTDGSGTICDEYAQQYPDNVLTIHKENGGVSSARNEGLKYIQGRFINFLDADDKLDKNVMTAVYKFFTVYEDDTDIVALPMAFFDGARGEHILNGKFKHGSRVINLVREWQTIQMSFSSAFVKAEIAENVHFDTALAYGEDGKEVLKILIDKMTLGVVGGVFYRYRKRSQGAPSAIQSAVNNPQWYMPSLKGLTASVISECLTQKGYIPRFVQYTLMYDLQWRFKLEHIPTSVMTEEEITAYKDFLFSMLPHFDDDVIMAQKNLYVEHKAHILKNKYGRDADILKVRGNAALYYNNTFLCNLNTNKTQINFISLSADSISLEGYTVLIAEDYKDVRVYLDVNGEKVPCLPVIRHEDRIVLDDPIYFSYGFQCTVPVSPEVESYKISIFCEVDGHRVNRNRLIFGKYCPVSNEYQNSYYYHDGYVMAARGAAIQVQKCGRKGHLQREYAYLKELWKKNKTGARKAVAARLLNAVLRMVCRKRIWIISDRIDRAGDNGEAFFRYMSVLAPKEIKPYFAISPNSPDYKRMKQYGRVIPFPSKRYKILYLLADCIISSQGEEYIFHPFQEYSGLYRDLAQTQKFVFLQHGVTNQDVSDWLNRFNKNISMFVTTTVPEYQSILSQNYYYTADVVKLTGFPRYDRLFHQEKKIITIMPTWRAYLVTGTDQRTGKRQLKPGYTESQYFAMYDRLLNSERLFDAAQNLGYQIAFLNHPNMSSAKDMIKSDPRLIVLDEETPYRTIFAESELLITDYSSVAFDFAYLRKPVIYFHQDKEEFFSGKHTYKKGYFDYEEDGFGEVEYSAEDLIERMVEYMENSCTLKEEYRERIDKTFPFSDQNNCQRVYEEILELK